MRRFPVLLLVAMLMIGLVPTAAIALTEVEEEVLQEFEMALNDLDCLTPEGCIEEVAELKVALAAFKAAFPDLDYTDIDACFVDFDAAVDEDEFADMQAAALCMKAAGAILVAEAGAEPPATTTTVAGATTTIAEVVTDLPDGGSGPSVGLLGAAALLVLLASGAFVLRLNADRR
jgi:hypothetical protein